MLSSLICDLVLGNIDGVSDTPDQQCSRREEPKPLPESVAAEVVTQAQTEVKKTFEGFDRA